MIYASFHPEIELNPQEPIQTDYDFLLYENNPFYVEFYHTDYKEYERYPFGLLNVVGYWAETQFFGGVLLFDRGESGLEVGRPHRTSCDVVIH